MKENYFGLIVFDTTTTEIIYNIYTKGNLDEISLRFKVMI